MMSGRDVVLYGDHCRRTGQLCPVLHFRVSTLFLVGLLATALTAATSAAEVEGDVLALYVSSTTQCYAEPDDFRLSVTFLNKGPSDLVVLPPQMHRRYLGVRDAAAEFVPFPGPRISPWKGALIVPAGGSKVIELSGMRDGDGIWHLEPGDYHVAIRYEVDVKLASEGPASLPSELRGVPVWAGKIESEPLSVVYFPTLHSFVDD